MSAEPKLTARSALSVLRDAPYRRYIIGSAISDTGTWMQVMAQGYVMSTLATPAAEIPTPASATVWSASCILWVNLFAA